MIRKKTAEQFFDLLNPGFTKLPKFGAGSEESAQKQILVTASDFFYKQKSKKNIKTFWTNASSY